MTRALAVFWLGLAAAARAADGSPSVILGLWGGYGSVGMKAINGLLQDRFDALTGAGQEPADSFARFRGGAVAGLEAGIAVMPGLTVAARAGWWSAGTAALHVARSSSMSFGPDTLSIDSLIDDRFAASVVPVMGGLRVAVVDEPEGNLTIGLFGGLGIASASLDEHEVVTTTGTGIFSSLSSTTGGTGTVPYAGSAVAGEVTVGSEIRFGAHWGAGVDLGYRVLRVANLAVAQAVTNGVDGSVLAKQGDQFKDANGNPIVFDFSGATVAVRGTFRF